MLGVRRDAAEYKQDAIRATILIVVVLLCMKTFDPYFLDTTAKEQAIARRMLEEAKQWYTICEQDQTLYYKFQHISFATAYLHAARNVVSDATLERITKIDVHALQKSIEEKQRAYSNELSRKCPKIKEVSGLPVKGPQKLPYA